MALSLKALAKEHDRPIQTLIALAHTNDPFATFESAYRRRDAEWFGALWRDLDLPLGIHSRRIHYRLVSQPSPVLRSDGRVYENTRNCSQELDQAVRDAVFLDLVPGNAIVDNKNPEPEEHLVEPAPALLDVDYFENDLSGYSAAFPRLDLPNLPRLPSLPTAQLVSRPRIAQRYHLEIWCEKSTMNDILLPLGQRYGVNIVTGTGDLSATACRNVVDRAENSGRPVRIFYVSDFDPGGVSMPVGVSRKIEFELYKRGLKDTLDIQVRTVVLTPAQCVELGLPRTPTKEDDSRAPGFEERFGEGATELDALEAIHPGKLAEILTAEIRRYFDPTLDRRVAKAALDLEDDLDLINDEVANEYEPEVDALEAEREEIQQDIEEIQQEFERKVQELAADFDAQVKPLWARATPIWERAKAVCERARVSLGEKLPDPDAIEWPTGADGDEDPDPLFDSRRSYIEQIDRYKRHQGKPTSRKART